MATETSPLTPYLNSSTSQPSPARHQTNTTKDDSLKDQTMSNGEVGEHMMDPEEVAQKFGLRVDFQNIARSTGLTNEQVRVRLERDGRNEMSPPKRTHPVIKYLKKLFGLFNLMLIVSGILGFILYIIDSSDLQNVPPYYNRY
jgi:sodium/potassium-transporting ATPase subunit alpha